MLKIKRLLVNIKFCGNTNNEMNSPEKRNKMQRATTGSSLKEWNKIAKSSERLSKIPAVLIEKYHLNESYIRAFVERINEGLKRFPEDKVSEGTIQFLF